jgi:hypothetical protein
VRNREGVLQCCSQAEFGLFVQDQVWFSLSFAKNISFGAIHIAPRDSLFFKPASFDNIQEMSFDKEFILLGNFNGKILILDLLGDPSKRYAYKIVTLHPTAK